MRLGRFRFAELDGGHRDHGDERGRRPAVEHRGGDDEDCRERGAPRHDAFDRDGERLRGGGRGQECERAGDELEPGVVDRNRDQRGHGGDEPGADDRGEHGENVEGVRREPPARALDGGRRGGVDDVRAGLRHWDCSPCSRSSGRESAPAPVFRPWRGRTPVSSRAALWPRRLPSRSLSARGRAGRHRRRRRRPGGPRDQPPPDPSRHRAHRARARAASARRGAASAGTAST